MSNIDADLPAASPRLDPLLALAPGLVLTAGIAALAFALRLIPGVSVLSPMILSVIIGVIVHNIFGTPAGTGVFGLPILQGSLGNPVLAAEIDELGARLVLPRNPDNLFFRKA